MRLTLYSMLLFACCGILRAQTNTEPADPVAPAEVSEAVVASADESNEPAAVEEAPEPTETHIYSDIMDVEIKSRSVVYRGNVRLDDPRIQLTCEQLSAAVPEAGGRVDRVVAETNVVIVVLDDEGKTNRAYADKAVYTYSVVNSVTNEVVELSGDSQPRIERPEGTLHGDVITWDRSSNQIHASNPRMSYRADAGEMKDFLSGAGTNAPAAEASSVDSDLPAEDQSAARDEATDE